MTDANLRDTSTGDFVGDRECVTHHACDCIMADRDRYRQALYRLHAAIEQYSLWEPGRAGHAEAHRALMAAAKAAGEALDG